VVVRLALLALLAAPAVAQPLVADGKRMLLVGNDGKLTPSPIVYRKDARISRDGKRLIWAQWVNRNRDLYACDHDGKNAARLTQHQSMDSAPDWGPDARTFVFNSERSGQRQVWLNDGKKVVQLTRDVDGAWEPKLSPDGKQVAFGSILPRRGKGWQASVVVLDIASGKRRVLLKEAFMPDLAWSPDGKTLAVGSFALTLIDVASGRTTRSWLFSDLNKKLYAHHGHGVTWSPDGKRLAMNILFAGGRAAGTGADGNPEWDQLLGDHELFYLTLDGKLTFARLPKGVAPVPWAWLK
jgi:Tol biopolymer transport system component